MSESKRSLSDVDKLDRLDIRPWSFDKDFDEYADGIPAYEKRIAKLAFEAGIRYALKRAKQVCQPENSFRDDWFEAKGDCVRRLIELEKGRT